MITHEDILHSLHHKEHHSITDHYITVIKEHLEDLLPEAMGLLTTDQKKAVKFHYFEEKSHKETGTIMHISPQQVNKLLENARNTLKAFFQQNGFNIDLFDLDTGIFGNKRKKQK